MLKVQQPGHSARILVDPHDVLRPVQISLCLQPPSMGYNPPRSRNTRLLPI